ncbi:PUTATIVE TWO-COMPONENT SENSOR [hydrothermal vent metagenome]|uniref:PUTATIVE TWO-COMPONENT SENSOR n=1 Tax=hydrothermal vent metagenome TaxID=652676 RepID=A0A1W1CGE3_9ZZZZ
MIDNILVVEDSKTFNKIVSNKLKDFSNNIDQVYTLEAALKSLEIKKYDLIILDLHLPDGEGLDLIYEIKSLTETKIIVLTAIQDEHLREELFRCGILDYIVKDSNIAYAITEVIKVIDHINAEVQDKILIIDDSKFICRQVRNILEPRNYNIEAVFNAEDGLKKIIQNEYNLIILDMELPDMHGSEVLKIIRAQKKHQLTPVMVFSGTTDPKVIRNILKNGANDYLKKPFIYEEFVLKVDLWIDYYKKEQSLKKTTADLEKLNKNLKQIIKEKIEQVRKKDEMVALIAHQWRQPLHSLSAATVLLEMKLPTNEQQPDIMRNVLDKMQSYIQHMSQTIDDFKDFFKPQREKKVTNLEIIFTKAYKLIEASLKNANIEININIVTPQNFRTYENEFVQVVINLLKNAVDILEEKKVANPVINVEIQSYQLSIEDNAGGVPQEIISKIFEPYFSTKSKNGTGLGLYMSKTIIQDHCGGELMVENTQNGAKFTISLPTEEKK